jgi:hypothetical protein
LAGPGLFYRGMRHLSRFVLRANGETPVLLEARTWGSEAEVLMTAGAGSIRVVRQRALGGGMNDEILLKREAREAIEARIEPGCEADFRDVFDVRGYRRTKWRGELVEEVKDGCLRSAYRREEFLRRTVVQVSGEEVEPLAEPGRLSLGLRLEPGQERAVRVSVIIEEGGQEEIRWRESAPLYGDAPVLQID